MLKHTTGISLIILLTLSLLLGGIPPSRAQKDRIEIIRKTVLMSFGDKPVSILVLNYTFLSNSTIIVSSNFGDKLVFSLPAGSWTQNSTHVLYHCISVSNVDVIYAFDITKNQSCKISMVGSAAATVAFPLKFSDVKLENLTLWNGRLGFNFSDIESKCTFNSRNSVLSISLSGSFNLDPTIISTQPSECPSDNQPEVKTFHDGTYFWATFNNGTYIKAYYSSDGLTGWTEAAYSTASCLLNLTSYGSGAGKWYSLRYKNVGGNKYAYFVWYNQSASNGAGAVYFRRDLITYGAFITWITGSTITVATNASNPAEAYFGKVDVEVTSDNQIIVCFFRVATAGFKNFDLKAYRDTAGDGSGFASDMATTTLNVFGSQSQIDLGACGLTNTGNDIYCLGYNGLVGWKGRYFNVTSHTWNSTIDTPTTVADYATSFGLGGYAGRVYLSYCTYIPSQIKPQFQYRNESSGAWQTAESFTSYDSRAGYLPMSVNASTGDVYVMWQVGNGTQVSFVSQMKSYSTLAWDSNCTQWWNNGNLQEKSLAPMKSTYQDCIPLMFWNPAPSNQTLQYALLNFTVPAAGLAWFNASTFNLILNTRQWLNGSSLNLLLNTRAWLNGSSLAFLLNARSWLNASYLYALLNTRSWQEGSTFYFLLNTQGWYDAATFAFQLASSQAYLIIPILFLALLIFGVLFIAIAYKRKGS